MNSTSPAPALRASDTSMECTGERMVPERSGAATFWEHVHRYRFASRFVKGKRVLDVACGEGYGANALLRAGAANIIGVDASEEACRHARARYGLKVHCADATHMPLDDGSIDLVVSFETIEHVPRPAAFVAECVRVLAAEGTLVISTPNRDVYSEQGHHNSFHCCEMNRREFEQLLGARFRSVKLYSQCLQSAPWWSARSLSALKSSWLDVRGFWRVRQCALASTFGREGSIERVSQQDRIDVGATILRQERMVAELFNPYRVRRATASKTEPAAYFVAVCRDPLQARDGAQ